MGRRGWIGRSRRTANLLPSPPLPPVLPDRSQKCGDYYSGNAGGFMVRPLVALGSRSRDRMGCVADRRRIASNGRAVIRIFVTGGTFDKQYKELTGALAFGRTHLPEMLRLGRSRVDVAIETLMMIDSLDMTAEIGRAS